MTPADCSGHLIGTWRAGLTENVRCAPSCPTAGWDLREGDRPEGPWGASPAPSPGESAPPSRQGKCSTPGLGLPGRCCPHTAGLSPRLRVTCWDRRGPGRACMGSAPQNWSRQGAAGRRHSRLGLRWPSEGQPGVPSEQSGESRRRSGKRPPRVGASWGPGAAAPGLLMLAEPPFPSARRGCRAGGSAVTLQRGRSRGLGPSRSGRPSL